jgi:hypothetical protein
MEEDDEKLIEMVAMGRLNIQYAMSRLRRLMKVIMIIST